MTYAVKLGNKSYRHFLLALPGSLIRNYNSSNFLLYTQTQLTRSAQNTTTNGEEWQKAETKEVQELNVFLRIQIFNANSFAG